MNVQYRMAHDQGRKEGERTNVQYPMANVQWPREEGERTNVQYPMAKGQGRKGRKMGRKMNVQYRISNVQFQGTNHVRALCLLAVSTLLNKMEINSSVSSKSGMSCSGDLTNFALTIILSQISVSRSSFSAILSL